MTLTTIKSSTKKTLTKLWNEEDGGELLEYALIAGLIVIAAIATIKLFTGALTGQFNNMKTKVAGEDFDG